MPGPAAIPQPGTNIETGTARTLLVVGRDVCAAIRRAADGESVTSLSFDGRPAAAIVPVDDHGNPACMRPDHMQALAQVGQLPPILTSTEAATYRFTAPAGVTCTICGDPVAAGAADLAVAWAAALEHEYKHRPGV